jgi:hypothetical protein
LAQGAVISNTALSIFQAKRRPGAGARAPYTRVKLARRVYAVHRITSSMAIQVSDPGLHYSNESAIAINPQNPDNIVAGAGTAGPLGVPSYNNSAFVSMDGGNTWKTVTVLADVRRGAGIAFDDSGNCYYTTLRPDPSDPTGLLTLACCVVSKDGGLTWSSPVDGNFDHGDHTAVAARGQIALCGFDRGVAGGNTEACAFTLDGGLHWTHQEFTDSGSGTAPLVSYDQQHFYIIYGALDDNLKIYVSADQGTTWTGPQIIVAGNKPRTNIAGPLSYQSDEPTCPGTNVAIDGSGTIHVLYNDSRSWVSMYTSSSDHGSTWSSPVNVDPGSSDAHIMPCLACNEHGDLVGGCLVYNLTLSKYSIIQLLKAKEATGWTTFEADNGAWSAAGPSVGEIGFGDYFDCDVVPQGGTSAMAWSETPDRQQPWQTWVRLLGCDSLEDAVEALEDEIANLNEGIALHLIPVPPTPQNIAKLKVKMDKLQRQLSLAEGQLKMCRDANPLPGG